MVEKNRKGKLLGRMKSDRSRLCLGLLGLQLAACSGGEENTLIPDSSVILLDKVRVSQTIHKIEVPANHFAFLRVDAPGSEIRASFRDENQPAVTSVKPLYLRSAPLFLCIDTDTIEPKNELKIDIFNSTHEFPVKLDSHFLDPAAQTYDGVIQGLRALCAGVVANTSESREDWGSQLQSLELAAQLLQQARQPSLSQWASYFHAYALYAPLNDYRAAILEAEQLATDMDVSSQPLLALLNHQLLGQALLEQDENDSPEQSANQLLRSHEEFSQAIELSRRLGNRYEESWALNSAGVAYFYQGQPAKSISKYLQAIQVIEDSGDSFLVNLYGQNVAVAQDLTGATSQALETLKAIYAKLVELEADTYANLNLIEQGRLYSKLHLYTDAVRVLSEALTSAQAHAGMESSGRINMFLGVAYQQLGQLDRSNEYLAQAVEEIQQANFANGLHDSYAVLASNFRVLGDFERMNQFRELQGQHRSSAHSHAAWFYEKSNDASAAQDYDAALEFTRLSLVAEEQSELDYLNLLGQLRRCFLQFQLLQAELCDQQGARKAVASLTAQRNPRRVFEGRMLWAEILALAGNKDEARSISTQLIEQIAAYRKLLPGVLGSWYWASRAELFHFHLKLMLDDGKDDPSQTRALLALRSLQNVNAYVSSSRESVAQQSSDSIRIRELLRELDRIQSNERRLAIAAEIDQIGFEKARLDDNAFTFENFWQSGMSGPEVSSATLLKQIPANTTLLVFYWSGTDLHAWTGNADKLQHRQIEVPDDFSQLMKLTGAELRVVNSDRINTYLDRMGEILIEPLRPQLQNRILFLASGAVGEIPLEAIRLEGRPLFEHYEVANLLSLNFLEALPSQQNSDGKALSFFIAGDPELPTSGLPALDGASHEIENLQKLLVGHSTSVSSGADFKLGVFHSPQFRESDIIHIASHGLINRQWPQLSQITLSPTESDSAFGFLMPTDLESVSIAAELVVLSACDTAGENRFEFDTGLGFISDFMRAGATSVVASLWPVADQLTAQFMREFYTAKLSGQDSVSALAKAKRKMINAAGNGGVYQQVAFQIYLR